ncbi:hypothetical protein IU501_33015 [Nocardia otitidiscaviarum]|uniref:hypothetical protein n=1 Tax=Nocardia otitidiscaviarum TaxID=1823 RepID=UPI0009E01202|nr:hypothetical protein [Nocardia otitidiscaviarum]MBF6137794.1 hypothetical protein [Nocardia otitidiscaviarum]MBF6485317.1 hypothetical protein [Nocardia otitidiscaviarum]
MPVAPVLLLAGPGVVFTALALSYRRDARRFPATGERPGAATLSASYGCLAALSFLWTAATMPVPAPFAVATLGVGAASLTVLAMKLRAAERADRWESALAVLSAAARVGEPEGGCLAARPSGLVRPEGARRLALLRRRQCAPAQHRHPHGTD